MRNECEAIIVSCLRRAVKVRTARTPDAGELLSLCCLATTIGHDRSTITGRVCGKLDSFHGSSATGW